MRTIVATFSVAAIMAFQCCADGAMLEYALESAGSNRQQLQAVLDHYTLEDTCSQKLAAARFLIENLPAHYSYSGTGIYDYYEYADHILADTTLTPEQQRDSLLCITDSLYSDLPNHTVPDAQIISAEYLINNIDRSYAQWTTCPWARQVTFDEFLEWMLPYKAVELQELDAWRDSVLNHFNDGYTHPIKNDVEYNTTMGVADMLRNECQTKMNRYGLYTRAGLPLLSAHLLPNQTFGNIPDYALMAVLLMRSAGIPAVLDETPVGARYEAATKWYVIIADKGEEEASEWDLSTNIGWGFFPYERGPKVYRNTYAINQERWEYRQNAKYLYPFDLGKKDMTSKYFLTCDLEIPVGRNIRKQLQDKYVYIASAIRKTDESSVQYGSGRPEPDGWQIVDFGKIRNGKACFHDMGREVLYQALGFDGDKLIPITEPFILHKDRSIEYVWADTIQSQYLDKWKNNAL